MQVLQAVTSTFQNRGHTTELLLNMAKYLWL